MATTRDCPRIVALDSGVGGLSILKPLLGHRPGSDFFYICDNGFFPYGTKSEVALRQRMRAIVTNIILPLDPDLVVVACGTASTLALDLIRELVDVPVIGVVPAIKPAAALSRSKIIGLLATPGTVNRQYTADLIDQFNNGCEVNLRGSDALVRLAEAKLRGRPVSLEAVKAEIEPLFVTRGERRVDVIVLGCTHFPLLQTELAAAAPWPVQWLEPAEAIVRRADALLKEQGTECGARLGARAWYFTAEEPGARELDEALAALGFMPLVHALGSGE